MITTGRSFQTEHLPATPDQLAARAVALFDVERGGDVTFHGPGQLVGYPIYDLAEHKRDLHWFLRQIEACLIKAVASVGIVGTRREGLTGVWVDER